MNISSVLMTVLLALNLHSLAARLSDHSTVASTSALIAQSTPAVSRGQAHIVEVSRETRAEINKMLGWKAVKGLSDDENSKKDAEKDDAQQDTEQNNMSHVIGEDTTPSDPRVLSAEKELTADLAERQEQDKAKISQADQQRKALEKERSELDQQIQELSHSASELSAHEESKRKAAEFEMDRLARVYEQMPPRDAAAVFDILDMRVMVPVAQRMIPRKVSAIIGGMSPDRANILSQYLAGMRKLAPEPPH
ncbi:MULTISPECIES: MotE family protein [unclassified Saccharibacter]|uniref:MotE family protein n=1 Tax=unclassified Saccharibacter TaxID=2648722 RepID=UPI0013246FEB|nr:MULTISPECIES: hypothetical protein [unclassified Saccharibacter]MXV36036.1 hypothetical protein [Saccharibacter sp. EH611]MXV56895.1 hypothetical protein [Saccharibacter sp. EH70]MXV66745.1 hypothetical protein [Saccharibacter sp. EH60]